ncbi:unnamed protein product [Rhizophagus irregularis]|nr:unnamed protein product [Rhizophagus irregularis]
MLEKLHIVEMGNIFLKNTLISQQLYCGIVLKGINGMQHLIALKMQIHGVPIVLDDMLVILIKPSKSHLAGMTQEYPNGVELNIPYYEYGFAIEVQGVQHKKYHEFFYRGDPNNFIKQQARDQLKKELCEKNLIALRYV